MPAISQWGTYLQLMSAKDLYIQNITVAVIFIFNMMIVIAIVFKLNFQTFLRVICLAQ